MAIRVVPETFRSQVFRQDFEFPHRRDMRPRRPPVQPLAKLFNRRETSMRNHFHGSVR